MKHYSQKQTKEYLIRNDYLVNPANKIEFLQIILQHNASTD